MLELLSNVVFPSVMASLGWGIGPYFDKRALEFYDNKFTIPEKMKKYCIKKNKNSVVLKFNKNEINVTDFIKKFEGMKNKIKDISTKETDLEEIFINLLKK